jgi:hypothetical protein
MSNKARGKLSEILPATVVLPSRVSTMAKGRGIPPLLLPAAVALPSLVL